MLTLVLLSAWKNLKASSPVVRKIKGTARVMAWVTCASAAGVLFLAHSANANARQTSLSFGRELSALSPDPAGVTHVKLNGQSIFYAQEFNQAAVHDVIAQFQDACERNPSAFGSVFAKIPKDQFKDPSGTPIPAPPSEIAAGVIKEESESEGMLICFTKSSHSGATFTEAMERFKVTQDLGEIGRMRYVYVKKTKEETQTITAWTEDSFRFDKIGLASSSAEAPAEESAIPRPAHARRVINAEVVGTPYGVQVYEVEQSTEEIATFYDNWAHGAGFTGIAPDLQNGTRIRAYFHDKAQLMVGSFDMKGKHYLSVSELTPQRAVEAAHPQ